MADSQLTAVTAYLQNGGAVVANQQLFKLRLAIGDDVYAVRRAGKSLTRLWDVASAARTGVAVAKSATVAAMLAPAGASLNPLIWAGVVAPVAAATPIGWVIAAGLAAGGAWYGVSRWWSSTPDAFVDVIPKFMNEPVELLAVRLLDLHATLAFRVATADGHVHDDERAAIRDHFVEDWGYHDEYLDVALPLIEADAIVGDVTLDAAASALAAAHRASRDCAPAMMQDELMAFLHRVAAADGINAPGERDTLVAIQRTLAGARALSMKQVGAELAACARTMGEAAEAGTSALRSTSARLWNRARAGE